MTDRPLTGSDAFLLALDYEGRTHNDASHLAQFCLKLDDEFDVDEFRGSMERLSREVPILSAPVERPYFIKPPSFRLGKADPSTTVLSESGESIRDGGEVPSELQSRLNETRHPGEGRLLDVSLWSTTDNEWWVAFTWLHFLFDGRGIEMLIRHLHDGNISDGRLENGTDRSEQPGLLERLSTAKEWSETMREWSDPTPRSLAGPLQKRPKQLRYRVDRWSSDTTERLDRFIDEELGSGIPMLFYLALSIRAHHAVFEKRGENPGQFLVPVTVNKYPDARKRPLFGTHVTFWWFRVEPEVATSFTGLLAELKRQRLELIKDEFHEQFDEAMSLTRYFPRWMNARMMRRETDGELASFFFSYTGELLPTVERFFGGGIKDMFHAPAPPASPGSSFVWSKRAGRIQLTHLFDTNAVSSREHQTALNTVREDVEQLLASSHD